MDNRDTRKRLQIGCVTSGLKCPFYKSKKGKEPASSTPIGPHAELLLHIANIMAKKGRKNLTCSVNFKPM
jgi:hypothetical protein